MREEIRAADFLGFFLKDIDELAADEFALFLRVGFARETGHEAFLGIDHDERNVVMVAEQCFDLLALVHAEQAVVDKDAGQLLANRFVNKDRRDRAIDPAR